MSDMGQGKQLIDGWWDSAISTVAGASAGLLVGATVAAVIIPSAPFIVPGMIVLTAGGAGAGAGYLISHHEHRSNPEQR